MISYILNNKWNSIHALSFGGVSLALAGLPGFKIMLAFLIAYAVAMTVLPLWIRFTTSRGLLDHPDARKTHKGAIPTMGGIGMYFGFAAAVILFPFGSFQHPALLSAAALLLMVGIYDDRFDMPAKVKLLLQIIAAGLSVYGTGSEQYVMQVFGINVSDPVALVLSSILFVGIINALNFMDGIDGLAGGIGFLNAIGFAIFFSTQGYIGEAIACGAIAGAALGFLFYNFRKGNARIFMGDTGSMMIGWFTASAALIALNLQATGAAADFQVHYFILGWIFLPAFDVLRLVLIRLYKGSSPFSADRRHLHHIMEKTGMSGKQSTFTLWMAHFVCAVMATFLAGFPGLPFFVPALFLSLAVLGTEYFTFRFFVRLMRKEAVLELYLKSVLKDQGILRSRINELQLEK